MVRLWRYGDIARMGIRGAWEAARHGVAVYGLRNVGLRALRVFVNLWKAAGVYGGSSGCMWNGSSNEFCNLRFWNIVVWVPFLIVWNV